MPISSRSALFAFIAAGGLCFFADGAAAAAVPAAVFASGSDARSIVPVGYRGRRTSRVYGYTYRSRAYRAPVYGYYAERPVAVYRPRVYGYYAEPPVAAYRPPVYGYYAERPVAVYRPPIYGYVAPPVAVYRPPVYGYYAERPVAVYRPPVYGYYAAPPVSVYGPRVYGYTATAPVRTDCGTLRYWNGGGCVDARFAPPPR